MRLLFITLLSATISMPALAQDALETLRMTRVAQGPAAAQSMAQSLIEAAPRNAAYRFEMGVIQAEQGNCASAWRHFEDAMRLMPLDTVRRARDQAMADLCPNLAAWEGSLNLTIIADDNYNNATRAQTIDVNGLPFTLSEESQAQQRYGTQIQGSLAYNYALAPGQYLVPGVAGSLTLLDQSQDNQFTLTPSLSYRRQGDNTDWRIGPALSYTWGEDGLVSESIGIVGSWRYTPAANATWQIQAAHWTLNAEDDNDDGTNTNVSLSYTRALENRNVLQIGIGTTIKDRALAQNSLQSLTLTGAYRGSLTSEIGFELAGSLGQTTAEGPNPFFGETRNDTTVSMSASLSFAQFETRLGRPYLGVNHTINNSSLELYDYDKTRLLFGFSRTF